MTSTTCEHNEENPSTSGPNHEADYQLGESRPLVVDYMHSTDEANNDRWSEYIGTIRTKFVETHSDVRKRRELKACVILRAIRACHVY